GGERDRAEVVGGVGEGEFHHAGQGASEVEVTRAGERADGEREEGVGRGVIGDQRRARVVPVVRDGERAVVGAALDRGGAGGDDAGDGDVDRAGFHQEGVTGGPEGEGFSVEAGGGRSEHP